jgi:hypothetical protein
MSRRSLSPEFDLRIADWLEDDPDHAPDAVLETVLAAFPSIPQRRASRVPWRTRSMTMSMTSRLLAGAAAVAVVLVGGMFLLRPGGNNQVGGPSPSAVPSSPLASPRESPAGSAETAMTAKDLTATFTSARYGFSVGYPAAWTATPATRSWSAGQKNNWSSGINDELAGANVRFSGAGQALAQDQTADEWLAEYGAVFGSSGDPATWPTVRIDGLEGRIGFDGVPAGGGSISVGGVAFDAVVVSGPYAYNFNMDGNVDRATFDAFLATVKLPDVPALEKTFTSPRAGYSIGYPASWTATPATKAWTTGYETEAFSDHIGTAPSIDGTSMKLPAGTTFDAWFAAYDADRVKGTCGGPSLNEEITIDGAVGHLDIHCPVVYIEAVVPKGGRVYVFTMFRPFNRPLFETLIGSVHLTPTTAKN